MARTKQTHRMHTPPPPTQNAVRSSGRVARTDYAALEGGTGTAKAKRKRFEVDGADSDAKDTKEVQRKTRNGSRRGTPDKKGGKNGSGSNVNEIISLARIDEEAGTASKKRRRRLATFAARQEARSADDEDDEEDDDDEEGDAVDADVNADEEEEDEEEGAAKDEQKGTQEDEEECNYLCFCNYL